MNLDDLERLAKEATPGPWSRSNVAGDEGTVWQDRSGGAVAWVNEDNETGDHHPSSDAAFIAAANPATILDLIAVVRAAEDLMRCFCEGDHDPWCLHATFDTSAIRDVLARLDR